MKRLKELRYKELDKNKKYVFILPIGATEQHGPFAPFGTDTYVTDYVVDHITISRDDIIRLPTLEYSRSQEHSGFPGTVYLRAETLKLVMHDICKSLEVIASKILITSFHANDGVINEFIKENCFSCELFNLGLSNTYDVSEIETLLSGPVDDHAGNSEISNMLIIKSDLVQIPNADYPKNVVLDPFKSDNLAEFCPDGIADNHPRWIVNEDVGQKILDIYVKRAISNLKNILNIDE